MLQTKLYFTLDRPFRRSRVFIHRGGLLSVLMLWMIAPATRAQIDNTALEEPESVGEVRDLEWEFRADRQYSLSHWWVQSLAEGRVRYGLDAFAACLLGHVTSTIFPTEGSPLPRGEPACWLLDDGELIPLRSPLTGSLLRTNRRLQENPALIGTSSYDEGWLLEARSAEDLSRHKHLIDAAEMRLHAAHDLRELYREVSTHLHPSSAVGPTLADGEPFTPVQVANADHVCVLGQTVARELFGLRAPVGETILVASLPCRVIGVLTEKGASPRGAAARVKQLLRHAA